MYLLSYRDEIERLIFFHNTSIGLILSTTKLQQQKDSYLLFNMKIESICRYTSCAQLLHPRSCIYCIFAGIFRDEHPLQSWCDGSCFDVSISPVLVYRVK